MTAKPLTDEQIKQLVFENLQNCADNGEIETLLAMTDEAAAVDMIFGTDDFEEVEAVDDDLDAELVRKVAAAIGEYRSLFAERKRSDELAKLLGHGFSGP